MEQPTPVRTKEEWKKVLSKEPAQPAAAQAPKQGFKEKLITAGKRAYAAATSPRSKHYAKKAVRFIKSGRRAAVKMNAQRFGQREIGPQMVFGPSIGTSGAAYRPVIRAPNINFGFNQRKRGDKT